VAVSIHGPGCIFGQPRLGQRWPLPPWPHATPSAVDLASVAGRHSGEERSGIGGGVLSLTRDRQFTENDIVAVSSRARPWQRRRSVRTSQMKAAATAPIERVQGVGGVSRASDGLAWLRRVKPWGCRMALPTVAMAAVLALATPERRRGEREVERRLGAARASPT
jgi:hypothetical protein